MDGVKSGRRAKVLPSLSKLIVKVYEKGQIFDSWSEHFVLSNWLDTACELGIDISRYTDFRPTDTLMPHEYIDCGIRRDYLLKEREKAYGELSTKNCLEGCNGCGANVLGRCSLCC